MEFDLHFIHLISFLKNVYICKLFQLKYSLWSQHATHHGALFKTLQLLAELSYILCKALLVLGLVLLGQRQLNSPRCFSLHAVRLGTRDHLGLVDCIHMKLLNLTISWCSMFSQVLHVSVFHPAIIGPTTLTVFFFMFDALAFGGLMYLERGAPPRRANS